MGPSYRAGHLREVALGRLRRLEREHGPSIAFECLGPPRLSKLLFEAHLLKRACGRYSQAPGRDPDELAAAMEAEVLADAGLRQRILSIGIPILLPDGERLLRGPTIKSEEASKGWVDLTTGNVTAWVRRLERLLHDAGGAEGADSSSRPDRLLLPRTGGDRTEPDVEPGEIAAWVFVNEEGGRREKC